MGVVKVIVNGETKVDLTPTTTEASEVNAGEVFFNRSGEQDVGTGDPPSTRVPVYGMGENLLRNGYFIGGGTDRGVFPVNQRGKSVYTATGYAIDGWKLGSNQSLTLTANGIQSGYRSGAYASVTQIVCNISQYFGQAMTISIFDSNGLHTASGVVPSSVPATNTTFIHIDLRTNNNTRGRQYQARAITDGTLRVVWYEYEPISTPVVTIQAIKLELGTEQTLAHQEGSAWVLNTIPDYQEELLKCQTSIADPSDYYANWNIGFNVSSYNFIDNWYFINPVNQRNITSGSTGAFIDRWRSGSATGFTFAVNSNGLVLTNTNTSSAVLVTQELSAGQQLLGRAVCLSILTSDGLYWATGTLPSSFNSAVALEVNKVDNAIAQIYLTSSAMQARIRCPKSTTLTVIAIKLEIGVHQTLAHIENDVWVPNEIPDYEEELIRCQTSTAYSDDTYANKTLATTQQIATIETSNTASQAYHIGQYFCKDGLLYRVTAEISSGATFTVGTNCVSTTAATWLPQELTYNLTTNAKFTSLSGKVTRVGNTVILSFRGVASEAMSSNTEIIRIPYAPPGSDGQILSMWRANTAYTCRINSGTVSSVPNGRIYINTNISANDNISITGIYFL